MTELVSQDEIIALRREARLTNCEMIAAPATAFRNRVSELWDKGLPAGSSTGWPSLDKHYTVAPGHLTIITGWPGAGKSEWLDALLLNLARQGWRFAIHSPENKPEQIHVIKFLEKFVGKPFGAGLNERMTQDEAQEGMTEIENWFGFLIAKTTSEKTVFGIEPIMEAAEEWFSRIGSWHSKENPCGLVIDPWNELEHLRPREWSETEYIAATLTCLRSWARVNNVHVWLVAHPQKLRRDDSGNLPVPRPDSISGSQNWWNKADNALTVWRALEPLPLREHEVKIYIQKIRFRHIGRIGEAVLHYDRVTGRYSEPISHLQAIK